MTQIDEKALDVAVESLRPLFREPVTYLEQAARDSISAYLATLSSPTPQGDGWLPIESAPKDGTRILVWRKYEYAYDHDLIGIDHWRDGRWRFSRLQMQPTHWRPFPATPAKGARDE